MTSRPASLRHLAGQATQRWLRHGAPTLSAAMAFYAVISLAPLLLIAMGIAGSILGGRDMRAQMVSDIAALTDPDTARIVDELLQGVWVSQSSTLVSVLAWAAFVFTSTMAFEHLRDSLNRVWETPPKPGLPLFDLVRGRLLSFALVLVAGVLLLVTVGFRVAVSAFGTRVVGSSLIDHAVLRGGETLVVFAALTTMFALVFRILPEEDPPWRDALFGGLLTTALFFVGNLAIGAYLAGFGVASAYGAVGSLVVLLFWVYYSSMVFLWGAELTCVYSRHGVSADSDTTSSDTGPVRGTPPPPPG